MAVIRAVVRVCQVGLCRMLVERVPARGNPNARTQYFQ